MLNKNINHKLQHTQNKLNKEKKTSNARNLLNENSLVGQCEPFASARKKKIVLYAPET